MNYIEMVNDAIHYIESNLHRNISLQELAFRYYISPTHFLRIFKAVTNQTVKSYILGRKLSQAAVALKETDRKVVDIAFQYGFNSHEQFTRDFIKVFHVAPSLFRKERLLTPLMERLDIIERDFKTRNKKIVVNYCCREIKEIKLLGKKVFLNPECLCEMEELIGRVYDFYEEYFVRGTARRLFSVGCSDSIDPSLSFCFYGMAAEEHSGDRSGLAEMTIPASRYAVFVYPDFMGAVFRTVRKDLDQWFKATGFAFNHNAGFDFFEFHDEDYEHTRKFYLYVPLF
ncbi:transcriptional regulator, AraC family [Desulfotomaculum arcticum]|uniref:Transcriptional regulator, AraC family n=1 Tax=Desulfotruncus arcticus DSM 17038 TaxID=1121424 RepID=A0A1I2NRG9_9FIRM|nr:AraC family transcriptional regulator [Desulfotruncus arcticus]SFG06514.1 transcriptional regulator, AraC family [Desulfotomaculum arcticum] [Desulfotruncus arcticus DSM 17038]